MSDGGSEFADVIVIGGGAMGSAAAYFLKLFGGPDLRVTVCEADPSYARSATLSAAGGIRQTFSLHENIEMSRYGAAFLREAAVLLAVDGQAPDLSVRAVPYLYLVAGGEEVGRLRACHETRLAAGAPAIWLQQEELAERFPWLAVEDVDAALLGGAEEGIFDPETLLRGFKRKAMALGASYRHAEVIGLDMAHGRIQAARLGTGERIACGHLVNAAGPGAAAVAAMAACDVPIVPRSAATFVFRAATAIPGAVPILVDRVQGLHVRPEAERFLAAMPGAAGTSTDGEIDHDIFESALWPALAHRVPAFEAVRFAGAWPGLIDASPFDGNPFVGPHPAVANFLFLAGFNGHGLQHAPAAGRAIAELVVHGEYRSIDLARFGLERLGDEGRIKEYY